MPKAKATKTKAPSLPTATVHQIVSSAIPVDGPQLWFTWDCTHCLHPHMIIRQPGEPLPDRIECKQCDRGGTVIIAGVGIQLRMSPQYLAGFPDPKQFASKYTFWRNLHERRKRARIYLPPATPAARARQRCKEQVAARQAERLREARRIERQRAERRAARNQSAR
jgi:hypothetical protein